MKALKIAAMVIVALVIACVAFVLVRAAGAEAGMTFAAVPAPAGVAASTDPAAIARGAYLVHAVAHCSQCHGAAERMNPAANVDGVTLAGGLDFAMGPLGTFRAANLTPAGIAGRTDAELARAIASGVMHDGRLSIFMRYSSANLSREDLGDVLSYLRSLPPAGSDVPRGEPTTLGKAALSFLPLAPDESPLPAHVPPAAAPSVERGAYLAEHVALCVMCHTTLDPTTFAPNGPKGGGGSVEPSHGSDDHMEHVAPNLTSSPTGITGKLDEDAFVARLHRGRVITSSTMPWENFSRLTDGDARSIYRYLRTLPPVDRDVGPTYREAGWEP